VAAAAAATVTAITAASASSSKSNTPNGSPTLAPGGKKSFRFSSLKKRRSKSHANIAPPPAKLLLQQQRERDSKESKQRYENPEQEILAFQRQLQNLPDFDSPEHPGPHDLADILASGEFPLHPIQTHTFWNFPSLRSYSFLCLLFDHFSSYFLMRTCSNKCVLLQYL